MCSYEILVVKYWAKVVFFDMNYFNFDQKT